MKHFLVILSLLAVPAPAWAGRSTIAILGVEAVDAQDPATTAEVAKQLTTALRHRAMSKGGPYVIGPGTAVELVDMKVKAKARCTGAEVACLAAIGADLGVDAVIYGKLEPVRGGYRVTLRLLDVTRKKLTGQLSETLLSTEASGAKLAARVKAFYVELTDPPQTRASS